MSIKVARTCVRVRAPVCAVALWVDISRGVKAGVELVGAKFYPTHILITDFSLSRYSLLLCGCQYRLKPCSFEEMAML